MSRSIISKSNKIPTSTLQPSPSTYQELSSTQIASSSAIEITSLVTHITSSVQIEISTQVSSSNRMISSTPVILASSYSINQLPSQYTSIERQLSSSEAMSLNLPEISSIGDRYSSQMTLSSIPRQSVYDSSQKIIISSSIQSSFYSIPIIGSMDFSKSLTETLQLSTTTPPSIAISSSITSLQPSLHVLSSKTVIQDSIVETRSTHQTNEESTGFLPRTPSFKLTTIHEETVSQTVNYSSPKATSSSEVQSTTKTDRGIISPSTATSTDQLKTVTDEVTPTNQKNTATPTAPHSENIPRRTSYDINQFGSSSVVSIPPKPSTESSTEKFFRDNYIILIIVIVSSLLVIILFCCLCCQRRKYVYLLSW